jgi:hypothetical protein
VICPCDSSLLDETEDIASMEGIKICSNQVVIAHAISQVSTADRPPSIVFRDDTHISCY